MLSHPAHAEDAHKGGRRGRQDPVLVTEARGVQGSLLIVNRSILHIRLCISSCCVDDGDARCR